MLILYIHALSRISDDTVVSVRLANGIAYFLKVVVNYANAASAAEETAEQIKQAGGDAIVVKADLSKKEEIQSYVLASSYFSQDMAWLVFAQRKLS